MKNPLSFFEREEVEVVKHTIVKKGIANYCCKKMKFACEHYKIKKDKYADSAIYNIEKNEIGMEVHRNLGDRYDYEWHSDCYDYYNYMKFKYCPFCGTKINGYIEIDEDK